MLASSTISATWRMKVLLPPMLGPVMTCMRVRRRAGSRWHEGAAAGFGQARLHHRVAAGLDLDAGLGGTNCGGTSSGAARARPGTQRVQRGQGRASRVSGPTWGSAVQHLLVQPFLARQRALLRRQGLVLEGLELRA